MRILLVFLFLILLGLQFKLWVGEGGLAQTQSLKERIAVQEEENALLEVSNEVYYAEIEEIENGHEAIEEMARTDLGLIREGETFYLIVDEEKPGHLER